MNEYFHEISIYEKLKFILKIFYMFFSSHLTGGTDNRTEIWLVGMVFCTTGQVMKLDFNRECVFMHM